MYNKSSSGIFIFQLLALTLSLYSMNNPIKLTTIKKPTFIVFPHEDIFVITNADKCVLTNIPNKESSILCNDGPIRRIIKHPDKPLIALSTDKELAIYDVISKTKIKTYPSQPRASLTFNPNAQELITYYDGIFIFHGIENNMIRKHQLPNYTKFKSKLNPIYFNKTKNEIFYRNSTNSICSMNIQTYQQKANYVEFNDEMYLKSFDFNHNETVFMVECALTGCYLYPQTRPFALKLFYELDPICSNPLDIIFHPSRNILAILENDLSISYVHTLSHKTIAQTHSLLKRRLPASFRSKKNCQMDFSPDGTKLIIKHGCHILHTPNNSLVYIHQGLQKFINEKGVIRLIICKLAQALCAKHNLKTLSLIQLLQS